MAAHPLNVLDRLLRFRRELEILWRAFIAPGTPLRLKALMLLVPLYLVSPIDILPDFIPVLGWIDDLVVIPMLVSWIVGLMPQPTMRRAAGGETRAGGDDGPLVEGTWRRR